MTPAKEIRRTRRVKNPFDASLEVRMYSTEKAKLFAEAQERKMTASDLVRSQLGGLIETAPPVPVEKPPEPDVDLAQLIADRLGIKWGEAMLKIRTYHVTIDGEPWDDTELPAKLVPKILLDGEPLPLGE